MDNEIRKEDTKVIDERYEWIKDSSLILLFTKFQWIIIFSVLLLQLCMTFIGEVYASYYKEGSIELKRQLIEEKIEARLAEREGIEYEASNLEINGSLESYFGGNNSNLPIFIVVCLFPFLLFILHNYTNDRYKKIKKSEIANLVLIILFLICLLPMPYGYFGLVRFISTAYFGYMAFVFKDKQNKQLTFFYICSAILFNPLVKFDFEKTLWNLIDVVYAAILIYLYFQETKSLKVEFLEQENLDNIEA